MGKTIRKFFDENGKESTAELGVRCQELVLNDEGRVVGDVWYIAEKAKQENYKELQQKVEQIRRKRQKQL